MNSGFSTLCQRIGNFLEITQDGYAIFSADDTLIGCNQAYADIMVMEFDQMIGQTFNHLYRTAFENGQGPNIETSDIELWLKMANAKRRNSEFRIFEVDLIDGRWFLISEQLLASGELLLQAKNISEQKTKEKNLFTQSCHLENLASTDELTQIDNRRGFIAQVESEIKRFKRNHKAFSFCLLDIDYFKRVNDEYGHQVGDIVLCQASALIKQTLREYDCFGRIGGEEFGILLPDTALTEAIDICNRLRIMITNKVLNNEKQPIHITISMGLVECQSNASFEHLYSQADIALYKAKRNGRNQVVIG